MKALAILGPIFGILASISTIWWNLVARRKYAEKRLKEPALLKALRITLSAVILGSVIFGILFGGFVIVANTMRNLG